MLPTTTGRLDLGHITVDIVMAGTTYDRRGNAVPVVLVDIPGRGLVKLRGHAVTYLEATIESLLG